MAENAAPAPAAITPPESMDDLVAQYVKLRDTIKAADDAHGAKLKPAKEYLKTLDAKLLERLNAIGGESVKTAAGTAYRTTRRSATIEDSDAFRAFVIGHEAFDIVDWRANANAVEDFTNSQGSLPPGVKFNVAYTVGVRRA